MEVQMISPGKIYGNEQANVKVLVKFVGKRLVTYVHIIGDRTGRIQRKMKIEDFLRIMKEIK
jgi:hypothetical protein